MVNWMRHHWVRLTLAFIVLGAMTLSCRWLVLVPIYQAPDECFHYDYVLTMREHGGPYRAKCDYSSSHFLLHSWTHYLLEVMRPNSIAFYQSSKADVDYGTHRYFRELNTNAPHADVIVRDTPTTYMTLYPFGYYSLAAGWMQLLAMYKTDLSFLFFGTRLLSVLLLGCTLLLCFALCRELGYSSQFSLLLTGLVGFFPLVTFVSSYIQPDNLSLMLTSLCYYLALLARRQPRSACLVAGFGVALGSLLVTKTHFAVVVALSAVAMLASEWLYKGQSRWRWLLNGLLLLFPSALLWSFHHWTTRQIHTCPFLVQPTEQDWLVRVVQDFRYAFWDYFAGPCYDSFWGVFGIMDTPLEIGSRRLTAVIRSLIQLSSWAIAGLTLFRLEQVTSHLFLVGKRRSWALAVRIACSHPLLNGFFLFTVLMFLLRAVYGALLGTGGAQGRYWLPFVLPMFLCGILYAPRALSMRRTQRLVAGGLMIGLVCYCLVGSMYALQNVQSRFYLTPSRHHLRTTPVVLTTPVITHDVVWNGPTGTGLGDDPYVAFRLPQRQFVEGVRLRVAVKTKDTRTLTFQLFWTDTAQFANCWWDLKRVASAALPGNGTPSTIVLRVHDTIDVLRFDPADFPCDFTILAVELIQEEPS